MTHQLPRNLSHKPSRRDENEALGRTRGEAFRSGAIAAGIYATLIEERVLLVAISDTGEVFAIDPDGLRGQAIAAQEPGWIVGVFTRRCGVGAIQRDMREHLRLERAVAA